MHRNEACLKTTNIDISFIEFGCELIILVIITSCITPFVA